MKMSKLTKTQEAEQFLHEWECSEIDEEDDDGLCLENGTRGPTITKYATLQPLPVNKTLTAKEAEDVRLEENQKRMGREREKVVSQSLHLTKNMLWDHTNFTWIIVGEPVPKYRVYLHDPKRQTLRSR